MPPSSAALPGFLSPPPRLLQLLALEGLAGVWGLDGEWVDGWWMDRWMVAAWMVNGWTISGLMDGWVDEVGRWVK